MTTGKDERKDDPRALSDQHPGRSRNQDEAPPIAPRASVEAKNREERKRAGSDPPPTPADLERRNARAHSAMPYGTGGAKRGVPAGEPLPEDPPEKL